MQILVSSEPQDRCEAITAMLRAERLEATPVEVQSLLLEKPVPSFSAPVPVILCFSNEQLSLASSRGYITVFMTASPASAEHLSAALLAGATDCWHGQMNGSEIEARANALAEKCEAIVQAMVHRSRAEVIELEEDQLAGQRVQMAMLPLQQREIGDYHFLHRIKPTLFLSGDFIDFHPYQENTTLCFLADVAGHGAASALITVYIKNFLGMVSQGHMANSAQSPSQLLHGINSMLLEQGVARHVAMFVGLVDQERGLLSFATAAQYPQSFIVGADGAVSTLDQVGKPLGLFAQAQYETCTVPFPVGSTLYVFSDGILDCFDHPDLIENENALHEMAGQLNNGSKLWLNLVEEFVGPDDISLMAVKRLR